MSQADAVVMGAEQSHDTLRRVIASREPCKILDAACGQGALARYLHEMGWDVHCADILPELFRADDLTVKKANLNRRLPYEDTEFDAVVCANAMHRLFNPAGTVREFYRILKPGGRLYINLNNYASIETRVRFLIFGSIDQRKWEEGLDPSQDPEADVRVRIMYPQVAQYLEAAGFRIARVMSAPPSLKHWRLAPWRARCPSCPSYSPSRNDAIDFCTKRTAEPPFSVATKSSSKRSRKAVRLRLTRVDPREHRLRHRSACAAGC